MFQLSDIFLLFIQLVLSGVQQVIDVAFLGQAHLHHQTNIFKTLKDILDFMKFLHAKAATVFNAS